MVYMTCYEYAQQPVSSTSYVVKLLLLRDQRNDFRRMCPIGNTQAYPHIMWL